MFNGMARRRRRRASRIRPSSPIARPSAGATAALPTPSPTPSQERIRLSELLPSLRLQHLRPHPLSLPHRPVLPALQRAPQYDTEAIVLNRPRRPSNRRRSLRRQMLRGRRRYCEELGLAAWIAWRYVSPRGLEQPDRMDAHDVLFRQPEVQTSLVTACASCHCQLGRGDHGGRSCRRGKRSEGRRVAFESRTASEPVEPTTAIVSLRNQRITAYDAKGWILRAPVSSGQKGRETPAGIFSVIEKQAEHYSNLYDDAYMPHMQRITWSGIALHGGPLPGHPASHGCVRMPYDFAKRLFGVTKLGMRVIVAPSDVAPVEIVHPALFPTQPRAGTVAAARAAEADEATRKADQARLAAVTASREAARATMRMAANLKLRAEAQLSAADRAVAAAGSADARERVEDAKAKEIG